MSFRIINSDCLDAMRAMQESSVDAIVTDPPYGIEFMGKEWDHGVPGAAFWREALRVAKPGAYLLAFGGTRTYHRLACAIEDAGWEIRDCIMWVYGCLDEDTEVLVNGEFVPYNKAKKGSLALGYDIESGTFSWQRIEDTYLYDYDDTAYAIQSDSTDQLVSRNHRCIVERGGVEQFVFAEQVALEREASVPVLEGLHGLLDRLPLPDERAGAQALRSAWGAKTTLARVTPVHYKGKMWCIKVATGAFVARRHGKIFITGNSGFPKSMDVSKAIDKAMGAERTEIIGVKAGHENFINRENHPLNGGWDRPWAHDAEAVKKYHSEFAPATPEAAAWNGWGTCLKPAWEPIIVARKPLEGTVAANVLKYGTGAINIDACRVPTKDNLNGGAHSVNSTRSSLNGDTRSAAGMGMFAPGKVCSEPFVQPSGRWPANLIHDGSEEVMECFPDNVKGGTWNRTDGARPFNNEGKPTNYKSAGSDKSVGSAARFFYCAKASKADRGEGNDHPTVKPIALMKYLVNLVCRHGGTVLDPFCGSGTTGIAAVELGNSFIGIERDGHYFSIAKSRLEKAVEKMDETAEL